MGAKVTLYTRNILETGTVTVTGTPDTGYSEERLYDRCIDLYWLDTVTGAVDFTVDQGAGAALPVDSLFIDGHNFDGEDLQWQYSTDNFSGDINDMVTDWTQSGSDLITKSASAQTRRYWRVTLSSMTNPQATEIFMSYGYEFGVQARPNPNLREIPNVVWSRTVGNNERSTKFGDARRVRQYGLYLDSTDLTSWRAAMDDLDGYSNTFYIKDHEDAYIFGRLDGAPAEDHGNADYTTISFTFLEVL